MKLEIPKVSVIVPVYKVEKYIEESVRSICEQQYQNIEIILVNDGTPDSSIELARKVAKNYSITLYVVNKENGGLPSARNVGIKAATGEYICFIDSDDMISTNHISDLVYACQKYRTKVAYADFQLTYEDNRCGMSTEHNVATSIVHDVLLQGFLVRKLKIHCCALLIDRYYLIDKNLWFNEDLRYGEDIDFMWRLFPTLDAIAYTGNNTYLYLQRSGSLMTSQSMERVITLLNIFNDTVKQLLLNYPDDRKVLKYLNGKAALGFINYVSVFTLLCIEVMHMFYIIFSCRKLKKKVLFENRKCTSLSVGIVAWLMFCVSFFFSIRILLMNIANTRMFGYAYTLQTYYSGYRVERFFSNFLPGAFILLFLQYKNKRFGSSYIAEAYYNFGYFAILFMPLVGILFAKYRKLVEVCYLKQSKNIMSRYFLMSIPTYVLFYVRSDAVGFFKSLVYQSVLPCIAIIFIDRLFIRRGKKR